MGTFFLCVLWGTNYEGKRIYECSYTRLSLVLIRIFVLIPNSHPCFLNTNFLNQHPLCNWQEGFFDRNF